MKLLYLLSPLLSHLLLNLISSEKIIKNFHIPSCKNCKFFKPSFTNSDFTSNLNKCEKFGEKNIITDEITYKYADSCRSDDSKCGNEGIYFEEEPNIDLKILKHSIVSNFPNWLIILSTILILRKFPF
jgi:hypothetical protein